MLFPVIENLKKVLLLKYRHFVDFIRMPSHFIPLGCIVIGISLSCYLHSIIQNKETDLFISDAQSSLISKLKELDLTFSNSALKVDDLEDIIGDIQSNQDQASVEIQSYLEGTLFKRLSIFKKTKDPYLERQYKLLIRIDSPNSSLPIAQSDYIESAELTSLIEEMQTQKSFSSWISVERNGVARLVLVNRSKIHSDTYFIFTAPLQDILDFTFDRKFELSQLFIIMNDKIWWGTLDRKIQQAKVEDLPNSSLFYRIEVENPLSYSEIPATFLFYLPKYQNRSEIEISRWVLATGLFITVIIAYLFHLLLVYNQETHRIALARTVDLENTAHDLRTALQSKSQFMGKISHEIRTPLNLILGLIDLSLEPKSEVQRTHYLQKMKISGEHLLSMVDDLLLLAKRESDLGLEPREIRIAEYTSELTKNFGEQFLEKRLDLFVEIAPDVPQVIQIDPRRLRQILMNLIRNGFKYTSHGYVKLFVGIERSDGDRMIFEVEDTGIGIQKDNLSKVFESFFRVDSNVSQRDGSVGLGLPIVRDLLGKMGGAISVKTLIGKGSKFRTSIPIEIINSDPWIHVVYPLNEKPITLICFCENPQLVFSLKPLSFHPNIKVVFDRVVQVQNDDFFAKIQTYTILIDIRHFQDQSEELKERLLKLHLVLIDNGYLPIEKALLRRARRVDGWPFMPNELPLKKRIDLNVKTVTLDPEATKSSLETEKLVTRNLKILIAEDDLGNVDLYKAYLTNDRWKIRYAENGAKAVELYLEEVPDLLILDYRMPVLDGGEALDQIRQYEQKHSLQTIPAIIVTADLLDLSKKTFEKYENTGVLTKPLKKSVLMAEIQRRLEIQSP